jgi:hypothetical protein
LLSLSAHWCKYRISAALSDAGLDGEPVWTHRTGDITRRISAAMPMDMSGIRPEIIV